MPPSGVSLGPGVSLHVSHRTLFLQAQQFFDQFPNHEYHDLERQEQEQRFNVRLRLYYVNIFHFSDSLEQELDRIPMHSCIASKVA